MCLNLRKMNNLYLDIDGTIITKQGGIEANHLFDFLNFATKKYDCYWLTTHCKGDDSTALEHVKDKVSEKSFELLKRLKPTNFKLWKTEGIDFTKDFIWLDDYAFDGEKAELEKNGALKNLVLVDLKADPDQLSKLIKTL